MGQISSFSKLIFFVGNSGSGKDTVMSIFKEILGIHCVNIKRYVTRDDHDTEKVHSIGHDEFQRMKEKNEFVLNWNIYGNSYGYTKTDVDIVIINKKIGLFNISRSVITEVIQLFPQARIVSIDVPKSICKARIESRKRDSEEVNKKRIARLDKKFDLPSRTNFIQNQGDIKYLKDQVNLYINSIMPNELKRE